MLHPINWSLALPYYAAAFCFGYLLGSIPFGLVLTRLAGTQDLRTIGSGNIGATNVLRTGRKGLAALTLVCDALKGTAAVLIASHFGGQDLAVLAALGAFLGHLFPVWLRFNGGKGVATYIGLLIAFAWQAALCFGRGLAGRRGDHPLLLTRRPARERRQRPLPVVGRLPAGSPAVRAADRADLGEASPQHPSPRRRDGEQNRAIACA